MAILSKIRDRSIFLILIVGLALLAFVLDPSTISSFFDSSKVNAIGQINGEDIDRQEFAQQVEAYRSQSGGVISQMQAVNTVWDAVVSEKVFQKQLAEAGIVVGEKDIWDAIVNMPEIQQSPLFKNEINLFDENKLKEYIANLKDEAEAGNPQGWLAWQQTEKSLKNSLERTAYTNLITSGLGVSVSEAEQLYLNENTKLSGKFVFFPFTSVADNLISDVTKKEVDRYVKEHPKRFKPKETRSLKYVKFDILPSKADEEEVEKEVASYIVDREEYNKASKATEKVAGLKNTTDYVGFMQSNKSDIDFVDNYYFKNQLKMPIADKLFAAEKGEVVGPYKEDDLFKISKVIETKKLPDSVKASHILIPFIGSRGATELTVKTEQQAKQLADSLATVIKRNNSKMKDLAKEFSADKSNAEDGGSLNWFTYNQMVPEFRDYTFLNKKGNIGVVKTIFGYHIVKIDDQKNYQKAIKIATFGRNVEPSEKTENDIFEAAETLASKLDQSNDINELAKENNYEVRDALNLKPLEEEIPGISSQRQVVTWAFAENTALKDFKRFDVEINGKRAYVVAVLTGKTSNKEAFLSALNSLEITKELKNEKKAQVLKEKIKGTTIEEIAKINGTNPATIFNVTVAKPMLINVGNEPKVVATMSALKEGELSSPIVGEKGVFVVLLNKKELPPKLDNYFSFEKQIEDKLKGSSHQFFDVLKKAAKIEDNRAKFY